MIKQAWLKGIYMNGHLLMADFFTVQNPVA
mgnify:CR=1 FL=1